MTSAGAGGWALLIACLAVLTGCASEPRPITLDTHVDIPRSYMRDPQFDPGTDTPLQVDLAKMRRGGLDAAFFILYVEQGPRTPEGYAAAFAVAEQKLSAIELMVQRYPDRIRLATSPDHVLENHAAGRLSALIGIENGFVIGRDLERLDAFYARGARYIGLTHNGHNDICTSSSARAELGDRPARAGDGLTAFGESVVRRANALGMMVDVSHASDECVRDVLKVSRAPIIASHSAARALADHPRNLPDDLLGAIGAKGGVVQVVAYSGFLKLDPAREKAEAQLRQQIARDMGAEKFEGEQHAYLPAYQQGRRRIAQQFPRATLEDYLDHIEHVVKVAGIDHVGIASDFDGGGGVQGWEDASETRNVTAGLRRRGFTEAQIAKLWSGNLLRVWREVERTAQTITRRRQAFDAIFDDVFAHYRLPGLALGVIEDGRVTYVRTAGETMAGSGQPVTPDTLFKIASNGKAMTTGVLARLVDAGKLRWTDPVIRHLPAFRMHDPWVTREMQVRDLLIHNSGLPPGAGDLMLWPEPNFFTRADILAGLAHLKPSRSFRSDYAYDNLLYIVAGEVAAAVAGMSYEEVLQRELFEPLGMERCRVGEWRLSEVGNVAQPHMRVGDANVVIRRDEEVVPASTSAAAGGIRCSLNDMLKWVRMWLHPELKVTDGSAPWLSQKRRNELWTAHTPLPLSERQRRWENSRFYAYGYGWRLSDVDGVLRVAHTGTLAGMYSAVTLLPEKGAGFVFMINGDGADARTVMNQALVKVFTEPDALPQTHAYIAELAAQRAARVAAARPEILPAAQPVEPAALKSHLGIYRDPWFGEVSICERAGRVRFTSAKSPRLAGEVLQAGDRLMVRWDDESIGVEPWLDFSPARQKPTTLRLAKIDPDADFSFDYEDLFFTRVRACP
jgi:microsomal dipeptidase-like Zn-dependent dipeptidase/CubicO group peptidase (beta-lactamase class C family)